MGLLGVLLPTGYASSAGHASPCWVCFSLLGMLLLLGVLLPAGRASPSLGT